MSAGATPSKRTIQVASRALLSRSRELVDQKAPTWSLGDAPAKTLACCRMPYISTAVWLRAIVPPTSARRRPISASGLAAWSISARPTSPMVNSTRAGRSSASREHQSRRVREVPIHLDVVAAEPRVQQVPSECENSRSDQDQPGDPSRWHCGPDARVCLNRRHVDGPAAAGAAAGLGRAIAPSCSIAVRSSRIAQCSASRPSAIRNQ